ncbi:MAG: DUF58 domain-containing protein [Cyanobacteria bacterium]|nr:DUF58 domain-containing protein [Cyanobacteriota bacterium]
MHLRVIPSRLLLAIVGGSVVVSTAALIAGVSVELVGTAAALGGAVLALATLGDYQITRRTWRESKPEMKRGLPAAFAIGVRKPVTLSITMKGSLRWSCEVYDHAASSLVTEGLPLPLELAGGTETDTLYWVVPTVRGEVQFAPADVRLRSRLGLCEVLERLGEVESRRVFPDFAQVARYAWLAGDRRLQEIGIKTYQQRGEGTDFKQLTEYRIGDPVRHIDWRATLRQARPIIREFQDERDQCVMMLVDCGRRMRAHDTDSVIGTTHFDQVLNAVMLLGYVALQRGDAVGAMTFGTPPEDERSFAARKGKQALQGLMSEFFGVQPTLEHSDYVLAAQQLLRRQRRRALVIIITNFRDEDASELSHALKLLRSRHLVLVASLRERIVGELIMQPLVSSESAIEIAGAQLYEQARRDAFNRLADRDALMVDAEADQLGIALVNRYHAVKRAGKI